MNVQTGESGIHAVRVTRDGDNDKPWSINVLVDFGPANYSTTPQLLTILGVADLRRLRLEIDQLLGHPEGELDS